MEARKRSGKWKVYMLFGLMLVLLAGGTYIGLRAWKTARTEKADLARFQAEEYQAAYLSMYPNQNYAEEDFAAFRGLTTVKASGEPQNAKQLSRYMQAVFDAEKGIEILYLGLDPQKLNIDGTKGKESALQELQKYLLPYMAEYPDVTFEILLPYPSLAYWERLSEQKLDSVLESYRVMAEILTGQPNVAAYFAGGQEWLIANPGNYEDAFLVNAGVSQKLFLYTFCDHNFLLTKDNYNGVFDGLKERLHAGQLAQPSKSDESGRSVVFFGDSIIGNYAGSLSIPGVVEGFSGARVYNCGYGGIGAAQGEGDEVTFQEILDAFLSGEPDALPEDSQAYAGLQEYRKDGTKGQKVCFVINFGLNDFFVGHPVASENAYDTHTYSGSLRKAVTRLKEAYPEAEVLLLTPSRSTLFENGTQKQGEAGGVLTDYVDAVLSLSQELSVKCINIYKELGTDKENYTEYLADGCHFNEMGRFLFGGRLVEEFALWQD